MRYLVTGGGGFLGRSIVQNLLSRGAQVRVFARGTYPELEQQGAEAVRGDVCDAEALQQACQHIDCVIHTAAVAGISMKKKRYLQVNTQGTENVIAACRQQHVPRLVYTSSPSVVFAGADQCGIDESVGYHLEWLTRNNCHYSYSKALAEQAVLNANDHSSGLKTCALRPHLIWGPLDNHLIPRLIQRARSGRLRRIGDGQNRVDIIYVDNAAEAHLLAADALAAENSPVAGKAYFLSQGVAVNCWDWINQVLATVNLKPVGKSLSLRTAWRLGHALEGVYQVLGLSGEPPMTRFLAAQLASSHWFDISAARRDLGYEPQISTEQGMEKLAKWLQSSL